MVVLNIDNVEKVQFLKSELDYERALSMYDKLIWMVKENKSLKPKKEHLKKLIKNFELKNWSNFESITNEQVQESDAAELVVFTETKFLQTRKKLIIEKLKSLGLKQQDLGKILNHRKNYMSELINGIRPFSKKDLVIIHKVLNLEIKYLIPPFIESDIVDHINQILHALKIPPINISIENEAMV